MPRRLDVKQSLLRSPCPIDPSTLPRVAGGFGCANCGRTVVDVAGLTLEELVALRRRTASGAERICAAYTLDGEQRVKLRAGSGSSAVIAVAVGVLLAACETGSGEKTAGPSNLARAASSQTLQIRTAASALPPMIAAPTSAAPTSAALATVAAPANSIETKVAESVVPSPPPAASIAKLPAAPGCVPGQASNSAHKGQGHKAHAPNDPQMLAGY